MAVLALALTWLAVVFKARGAWRRNAPPARRALWVALLALALGWTLRVPAGYHGLNEISRVPNLSQLVGDAFALTTACAILIMLLFQTSPPDEGQRKLRLRLVGLGVAVLTMTVTFFLAPVGDETTEFFERYADEPLIWGYALAYLGFVGYAFCDLAWLCGRYARLATRRFLKVGMRLLQAAGVTGICYVLLRIGYLTAVQLGWGEHLSAYDSVSDVLVAITGLLVVSGATLPALGRAVEMYVANRELYPLWKTLYRATPGIALIPPASRLRELLNLRELRFRLNSKIIEIRDGRASLQSYFRRDVANEAHHLARQDHLAAEDEAAAVEAATLAAAARDKAAGKAPRAVTTDPTPGGSDLASELSWLRKVARAFNQSKTVQQTVQATSEDRNP